MVICTLQTLRPALGRHIRVKRLRITAPQRLQPAFRCDNSSGLRTSESARTLSTVPLPCLADLNRKARKQTWHTEVSTSERMHGVLPHTNTHARAYFISQSPAGRKFYSSKGIFPAPRMVWCERVQDSCGALPRTSASGGSSIINGYL